jgi:hypothetical protein
MNGIVFMVGRSSGSWEIMRTHPPPLRRQRAGTRADERAGAIYRPLVLFGLLLPAMGLYR